MPKYIKAEALIDDLLDLAEANKGTYHEEGFKNAITVVEMQPAADVVPTVRCKPCRFSMLMKREDGSHFRVCLNRFFHGLIVDDTDFCSRGR